MQRAEEASHERGWKFELYEERLAFSGQPAADFWYALEPQAAGEPSSAVIHPLAAEGHGWTDVAAAREQFGLRGGDQTVAIIDSGIAYDHVALGGGLGKAYRVVGGWDFAENDANPYDDGPAGFHGTHVAGIVGAQDARYAGVAPDVDLVALRVLDDKGGGNFAWVEQALQWVHANRNAFEHPITTVNLSLGTEWNASSLPKWATFEEELQQLAADGIFISVAAGNSFLVYGTAGLSYPAVSQFVTPVSSVDASGNLSRFTQRDARVLAAPGERVMSTLPDHFYGGDGVKNDWGATSGSSMAAPYVAGASVLVREAMQDLGLTNITQSTIYDLLRRTADTVYDAATKANYQRINLTRALDSLLGTDDYGSTAAAASSLGRLTTTLQVSGTIGRASDQDFFQFTAASTGRVTLTRSVSEGLSWVATTTGNIAGNKLTLDVIAGQSYVVGVAGSSIGKYKIDVQLAPSSTSGSSGSSSGNGAGSPVTIVGGTATIAGTATADAIVFNAATPQQITINGTQYSLGGATQVRLDGRGGNDTLTITGGSAIETVRLRPGSAELAGGGITLIAVGVENTRFYGSSNDRAWFFDSTADDRLDAGPTFARMTGSGWDSSAFGCGSVSVVASAGGRDTALLRDSAGADRLDANSSYVWLRGAGYGIYASGFDEIVVQATAGGNDLAAFLGGAGSDSFSASGSSRGLVAGGVQIQTSGFRWATFSGGGGSDTVDFYSSSVQPRLRGRGDRGQVADGDWTTDFAGVEAVLANVRQSHQLQTDLQALDFVFRRIGRA